MPTVFRALRLQFVALKIRFGKGRDKRSSGLRPEDLAPLNPELSTILNLFVLHAPVMSGAVAVGAAAMVAAPFVLGAAAIGGAAYGIYKLADKGTPDGQSPPLMP